MYQQIKPLLFKLTPEQAHELTISMLRLAGAFPGVAPVLSRFFQAKNTGSAVNAFGLRFPNPVGLAAGYDKDGLAWKGLISLGFGHLELGTVTPLPQSGNPKPRLYRLPEDQGVINRMGFNNAGVDFLAKRLRNRKPGGTVIGVNIGKNKATPLENAHEDYLTLTRILAPLVDYLAVNVSSPNTPGLRSLQTADALRAILEPVAAERTIQAQRNGKVTPILVKLAPDLEAHDLETAVETVIACGMDGIIMGNTTVTRTGLHSEFASEVGGLSGTPLTAISRQRLADTIRLVNGRVPVVASGGIMTPEEARIRMDLGAALIQVYSGLIYAGPGLVKDILNGL